MLGHLIIPLLSQDLVAPMFAHLIIFLRIQEWVDLMLVHLIIVLLPVSLLLSHE